MDVFYFVFFSLHNLVLSQYIVKSRNILSENQHIWNFCQITCKVKSNLHVVILWVVHVCKYLYVFQKMNFLCFFFFKLKGIFIYCVIWLILMTLSTIIPLISWQDSFWVHIFYKHHLYTFCIVVHVCS